MLPREINRLSVVNIGPSQLIVNVSYDLDKEYYLKISLEDKDMLRNKNISISNSIVNNCIRYVLPIFLGDHPNSHLF